MVPVPIGPRVEEEEFDIEVIPVPLGVMVPPVLMGPMVDVELP